MITQLNKAISTLPEDTCGPLMILPLYAALPPEMQVSALLRTVHVSALLRTVQVSALLRTDSALLHTVQVSALYALTKIKIQSLLSLSRSAGG